MIHQNLHRIITSVTGLVVGATSLALSTASVSAAPWGSSCLSSHLYSGSQSSNASYGPGAFCSTNGSATTTFQSDGNLVTYVNGHATWSSRTNGLNATRFVLQADGNLVIYRVDIPLWNTHTNGQIGAMGNAIQQLPDGQFNAYKVNSTDNLTQIW